MKRVINIFILCFLILLLQTNTVYSKDLPVSYNLKNGYTAVRNDVLNKLVENDKLIDVYKEEATYYKESLAELKELQSERFTIQNERIFVLKETISVKDDIINLKDKNIDNYKSLYDIKSTEVRTLKRKTLLDKLLVLGIGAYGVSQIEDTGGQIAVGAATLSFILK